MTLGHDSGQTGPVSQRAVFDGFHAWKHASRFQFPLEESWTDDPEGLRSLVDQLAPDLSSWVETVRVVSSATLAAQCHELGLRAVHHTRVVGLGEVPLSPADLFLSSHRAQLSTVPAVLVDGARHPGNLGAVVRVAAAVGCPAVFSLGGVDPWLPEVIRAAAGLHSAVPVVKVDSVDRIEGEIVVLHADGGVIGAVELSPGSVLAVGAERHGVSAAVSDRASTVVALPMTHGVSSLNLATSVAAALYVHISRGN